MRLSVEIRRRMKRLPGGRALWRFGWAMSEHGAFRAASAIAFDAFLSVLPLLALAGWALRSVENADEVFAPFLAAIPGPASQLARVDLLRFGDASIATLAPLGAVGFVWLASGGVATAMAVCETMFAAIERKWLRRRALAMIWVLAIVAVLLVATVATIAFTRALGPAIGRVVAGLLTLPIVLALLYAFFHTAIRRSGVRRRVWPGTALTASLWVVLSVLFSIYTQTLARFSLAYGELASVAMLLFWFWLLALALLAGGELNAQLEGVREFPPSTVVRPPGAIDPSA